MKAITVTKQIKDLNIPLKYFLNNTVGSIKTFSTVPKSLFSPTYNIGLRTDGYHTLDNSIHEADGFFDVVPLVSGVDYDPLTQNFEFACYLN